AGLTVSWLSRPFAPAHNRTLTGDAPVDRLDRDSPPDLLPAIHGQDARHHRRHHRCDRSLRFHRDGAGHLAPAPLPPARWQRLRGRGGAGRTTPDPAAGGFRPRGRTGGIDPSPRRWAAPIGMTWGSGAGANVMFAPDGESAGLAGGPG